ncbi:hypothetical protein LCGC14_0600810 [marine sediment metagenome]|uniref:Uncharacterized protein n=1 Tax=marine sediment metagenome TaxID=412755 RepID=A0A0F9RAP0_9ZZZZ
MKYVAIVYKNEIDRPVSKPKVKEIVPLWNEDELYAYLQKNLSGPIDEQKLFAIYTCKCVMDFSWGMTNSTGVI